MLGAPCAWPWREGSALATWADHAVPWSHTTDNRECDARHTLKTVHRGWSRPHIPVQSRLSSPMCLCITVLLKQAHTATVPLYPLCREHAPPPSASDNPWPQPLCRRRRAEERTSSAEMHICWNNVASGHAGVCGRAGSNVLFLWQQTPHRRIKLTVHRATTAHEAAGGRQRRMRRVAKPSTHGKQQRRRCGFRVGTSNSRSSPDGCNLRPGRVDPSAA